MYPLPVLQALIDEAHRLEPEGGVPRVWRRRSAVRDHRRVRQRRARLGLSQAQLNEMVEEGSLLRPDLRALHRAVHGRQRRQEHRRQVPDDSRSSRTRCRWPWRPRARRSWSAAAPTDRRSSTARRRSSSPGSSSEGMTTAGAIQAGTIVNAEAMGWKDQSARSPKASSPISSRSPAIRWPTSPSCSA